MHPPRKSREFLIRPLRLLIVIGSVFLLGFFFWSAGEARKNTSNRIVDWLPQDTEELEVFSNRYIRHFPEGEYLMASWKGCSLNDERLQTLAAQLTAPLDDGSPAYFSRIMTAPELIETLSFEYPQMSESAIKSRLVGWLIGKDSQTACLLHVLSERGREQPADAIEYLFASIETATGLPRTDIYIAGPSIDSVTIDEISKKSQQTLLPFFLLFSLFLVLCCLRNFFAAFIVFWAAVINEELGGALLYWTGAHVDSISMLISALVYVLSISGSIHLINYYRKTLAEMEPGQEKDAPVQTFHKAVLPCSLAILTTIMGMGSLAVSKMVPIQTFGLFASFALLLGMIWFFLYILSALQEYPIRQWFPKTQESSNQYAGTIHVWEYFGRGILYCRYPITIATFLMLIVFAFGIKDINTTVTFHGMLPKEIKSLQDYRTLEEQIGGLVPVEVVVHFPDAADGNITMLDQLHFLTAIIAELRKMKEIDTVISVLNFLPNLPSRTDGGRAVAQRAAMEGKLSRSHKELQELRFFDKSEDTSSDAGYYWRVSLRVSTQKRIKYAVLIAGVKERLEIVKRAGDPAAENVRFDVTGGVPLAHRAQDLLLWDLINSFTMAFGLITITMMVALRGIVRGLLAMIPNIFPCVVVFGMLGLCGIPIDMGSMMTASVALGISVDGTFHLLTWMNIELRRGNSRKEAVLYSLRRCCTALFQTTLICGVGMLVFGLSDFVPVSRFAILLCIILTISFAGTVISLPAIIFSPLGRFFELNARDNKRSWNL